MIDLIFDTLEESAKDAPKSALVAAVAIVAIFAIVHMDEQRE